MCAISLNFCTWEAENIKKFVCDLIEKHGTRSPFELCEKLDINILFVDLPDSVNGFFLNSQSKKSILIKNTLSSRQKEKVCAHELAHALLHSCVNAVNFEGNNLGDIDALEKEAHTFSKLLLRR